MILKISGGGQNGCNLLLLYLITVHDFENFGGCNLLLYLIMEHNFEIGGQFFGCPPPGCEPGTHKAEYVPHNNKHMLQLIDLWRGKWRSYSLFIICCLPLC